MRCLFLGYDAKKTKLIKFLKKKKLKVFNSKKSLTLKLARKFDIIISFGYRKIISKKIIASLKRPIINLHMSYLPYNKGAHPNYWSFIENTKKGITIHEIDEDIDTGNIIMQKEIRFNLKMNKNLTFKQTYKILFNEIENLFIKNYKKILSRKYTIKKNFNKIGSFHKKDQLPKSLKNWDIKILDYVKSFSKYKK